MPLLCPDVPPIREQERDARGHQAVSDRSSGRLPKRKKEKTERGGTGTDRTKSREERPPEAPGPERATATSGQPPGNRNERQRLATFLHVFLWLGSWLGALELVRADSPSGLEWSPGHQAFERYARAWEPNTGVVRLTDCLRGTLTQRSVRT